MWATFDDWDQVHVKGAPKSLVVDMMLARLWACVHSTGELDVPFFLEDGCSRAYCWRFVEVCQ